MQKIAAKVVQSKLFIWFFRKNLLDVLTFSHRLKQIGFLQR